ncbi:hypothetical protein QFC21_005651 [Naganishia friedmannii]|uniref:Uncharacterized protein n=1 Tax=Naganishia friedmannii TaxID=89922 RepID=A0ACC2V838_9TREE|nr:hypothetical protein QFC21_005651 [Naganishia friedmannii]
MRSLAKKPQQPNTDDDLVPMLDLFPIGEATTVLDKHRQLARRQAEKIVQTALPSLIEDFQHLLDSAANDEFSPFWKGHLESEHFARGLELAEISWLLIGSFGSLIRNNPEAVGSLDNSSRLSADNLAHCSTATYYLTMPSFAKKFTTAAPGDGVVLPMLDSFRIGDADTVLQKHKQSVRQRAQEIVQTALPAYIEHLQHLLDSANSDESSVFWKGHLESEDFAKGVQLPKKSGCCEKRVHDTAGRDANGPQGLLDDPKDALMEGTGLRTTEAQKYQIMMQDLRTWTRLEKPTIEDGGNFGVGVQEKVSNQIKNDFATAEEVECFGNQNYYRQRQKLGTMWCRYPNFQDHATALKLADTHFFLESRMEIVKLQSLALQQLNNLRNNWVKVCDPKGREGKERSSTLY